MSLRFDRFCRIIKNFDTSKDTKVNKAKII